MPNNSIHKLIELHLAKRSAGNENSSGLAYELANFTIVKLLFSGKDPLGFYNTV
jgi:hypothetical protein